MFLSSKYEFQIFLIILNFQIFSDIKSRTSSSSTRAEPARNGTNPNTNNNDAGGTDLFSILCAALCSSPARPADNNVIQPLLPPAKKGAS